MNWLQRFMDKRNILTVEGGIIYIAFMSCALAVIVTFMAALAFVMARWIWGVIV
jgi:hypothetical protein